MNILKILRITIFLLLGSCATTKGAVKDVVKNDKVEIYNEVVEYFKLYFPEVGIPKEPFVFFVDDIDIIVPDPSGKRNAHAYCKYNYDDSKNNKIIIGKKWWDNEKSDWYRKKVLMHEFGHCLLSLRHPSDLSEYTIMNITLSTVKKDGSNWVELMNELRRRWDTTLPFMIELDGL